MGGEEHKCIHEKEITLLVDHNKDMARDLHRLVDAIKGNGKPGIVTNMALQKQCVNKLHGRLDDFEEAIKEVKVKAEQCDENKVVVESLKITVDRLWKVMMWGGGLTMGTVIAAVIKIAFFGG